MAVSLTQVNTDIARIEADLAFLATVVTGIESAFSIIVGPVLASLRKTLIAQVTSAIGQVANVAAPAITTITNAGVASLNATVTATDSAIATITNDSLNSLNVLLDSTLSINQTVQDSIIDTTSLSSDVLLDLEDAALDAIEQSLAQTEANIDIQAENVALLFEEASLNMSQVSGTITQQAQAFLEQSFSVLQDAQIDLSVDIQSLNQLSTNNLIANTNAFQAAVMQFTNELNVNARSFAADLIRESDETQILIARAIGLLSSTEASGLGGIGATLLRSAAAGIAALVSTGLPEGVVKKEIDSPVKESPVSTQIQDITAFIDSSTFDTRTHPILGAIQNVVANTFGIMGLAAAAAAPTVQAVSYDAWKNRTVKIPDLADVIAGKIRGLLDDSEVDTLLEFHGYSLGWQQFYRDLARVYLPVTDMLAMQRRGLYEDDEFGADIKAQGYNEADQARLTEVLDLIPPINDIIAMAVREVFSPEIAEKFGQFEDFPEEVALWGERLGLTEDWAKKYWAAHWALPGASQGFEMFHRKIIDRESLEQLLRALDVMPFWRDNLIQMSHRVIGRVDIRRIDAMFDLSPDELQTRYEAFGYSPEDSELLVEWTKAFNAPDEGAIPEELKGFTRATITKMFKLGTINDDTAVSMLESLGIGDVAARAFIDMEILTRELQDREDAVKDVIQLFSAGAITFKVAQDQMNDLDLEQGEITAALNDLSKINARADKLPPEAMLTKMFKKGIIDEDQYKDALHRHGFSTFWVDGIVLLAAAA